MQMGFSRNCSIVTNLVIKPNSFCGLPVVLPDFLNKHSFSVHEPSLNSRDLEFEGKGSLFKSKKNYGGYTLRTEPFYLYASETWAKQKA